MNLSAIGLTFGAIASTLGALGLTPYNFVYLLHYYINVRYTYIDVFEFAEDNKEECKRTLIFLL